MKRDTWFAIKVPVFNYVVAPKLEVNIYHLCTKDGYYPVVGFVPKALSNRIVKHVNN